MFELFSESLPFMFSMGALLVMVSTGAFSTFLALVTLSGVKPEAVKLVFITFRPRFSEANLEA